MTSMSLEGFRATLTVLVLWTCLVDPSMGWPVPESNTTFVETSRRFIKPSVVTSVSVVRKQEDGRIGDAESAGDNRPPSPTAIGINFYRLPPSPANLLKPDGFQFYTYNERGDMITKQMTIQEIQALIASGGPDHSNTGIQEPQKVEDILTGGKKVMDVVEKVQKVLKSAMGKPSQTLTDSISTVPEKVNAEWSNILPAILAGDKYGDKVDESSLHHYVEADTSTASPSLGPVVVVDTSRLNGTGTVPLGELLSENVGQPVERNDAATTTTTTSTTTVTPEPTMTSYNTEKLMIPVAVITAAQKPQMVHRITDSPIFQKITDIPPAESAFDEKYNNHDPATPIVLPLPLDSSKNSYDSTDTSATATSDTDSASVTDGYEIQLSSTLGTNKLQTLVTNPQFTSTTTTPPLHSPAMFDTSTGESSKVSPLPTESSTRPSDSDSEMQHLSRPLSNELADSLSSMMNQVSEVSVPSILLPASSGLELPDRETVVIEEKRNNNSETRTSTTTTLTTTASAVPTTKLNIDLDQFSSTTSPATMDSGESTANSHSDITTVATDGIWNVTSNLIVSSTAASDQTRRSSSVTVPTMRETTTPPSNLVESLETKVSSAESVAIIENILENISTEANTPLTASITLPNISSENLPTKTLASGLVAGFGLSDSPTTNSVPETHSPAVIAPFSQSTTTSKLETQTSASVRSTVTETTPEHIKLTTGEECCSRNEDETQGTSSTTTTTSTTNGNTLAPDSRLPETNLLNVSVPAQGDGSSEYTTSSTVYETAISSGESGTVANAQDTNTTANLKKPEEEATEAAVFETVSRPERISPVALKKDDRISMIHSNHPTGVDTTTKRESPIDPINDEATPESTTTTTTYNDASMNANQSTVSVIKNSILNATTVSVGTEASSAVGKGDIIAENDTPVVTTMKNEIRGSFNATIGTNSKGHEVNTSGSSVKMSDPIVVVNVNKNATDVESVAHKWQRISLRQTTPLPSSPSSSSLMDSTVTSKKPKEPLSGERTGEDTRYQTTTTTVTTTTTTTPTPTTVAEPTAVSLNASKSANGLDSSTTNASPDVVNFSKFCNELAFKFWIAANKGLSSGRSLALSPFGMVSLLAMIFLGARGPTSDQMNEVLGLDNVATFNPHLIFQNVTDTVSLARHQGIANAAFVRELFADKAKVRKLLPFYKEQAQQFYEGLVAEVNFATISDLARRRTNLLVRKQTGGRIKDFVKSNSVHLRSPLAAISANVFQTDCNASLASTTGRDGELYFAVSSSAHRSRKLIPVPAAVWRSNVLAGYEPSLDATAVALGGIGNLVSTIFLLPGQQGHAAPGDTLDRLEERLVRGTAASSRDGAWNRLLKVLIPRPGLELQIPKFSHRSVINATAALKRMGLDELFSSGADFKGINGIGNRLFLSDVLQMNLFSTCGDENVSNGRHHVEIYPASPSSRESRRKDVAPSSLPDSEKAAFDSATRSSERLEDKPRLKLDQPFLYFVRHNPTGLILHMGRFNPRLL